jgi:hypothetical protein
MEYLILVVVCAAVVGYLMFRQKNKKAPQDTYVCDVCGEKECLCRKVEEK